MVDGNRWKSQMKIPNSSKSVKIPFQTKLPQFFFAEKTWRPKTSPQFPLSRWLSVFDSRPSGLHRQWGRPRCVPLHLCMALIVIYLDNILL
jgi:hypothetical protein